MTIIRLGKLEIDLDELAEFIVKAKKHSYAGGGEKQIMFDSSKKFTFQEGNFWYEDNYDGKYQAPGRELVKWQRPDGQWIWQLAFSGGVVPTFFGNKESVKLIFNFLKKALYQVTPDRPFRGPELFREGNFIYYAKEEGDIKRFVGKEEIFSSIAGLSTYQRVFTQDYSGCLVIP